jgi:hypothetical protein
MMDKIVFNTCGDGYWSTVAKPVEIVDMRVIWACDDKECGELAVYFNTDTWNVDTDGLIYTDSEFYADLQAFIKQQGLVVDLCYSEQGMQGDDYVSFDIGADFLRSWEAKFGLDSLQEVMDV